MAELDGIRHIEWELLTAPLEVENLSQSPNVVPHPTRAVVSRNDDYDLNIAFEGETSSYKSIFHETKARPGELLRGDDITGTQQGRTDTINLLGVFAGGRKIQGDGRFTMAGSIFQVTRERDSTPPTRVIEYCISGPRLALPTRNTEKRLGIESTIARHVDNSKTPDFWTYKFPLENWGGSWDSFYVKNKYFEVLCVNTSETFAPPWLKAISVQFGPDPRASESEYRNMVLEALSFALGRRLISVGHTLLDKDHYPIKQVASRPFSRNLKRECAQYSTAPCHLETIYKSFSETALAKVTELYLDSREKLALRDVMWSIWTARSFLWGMNFVAYSGALELLAKTWLGTEKNRAVYVPKDEFDKALGATLTNLSKQVPATEEWKPISRKLLDLNSIGSADRVRKFFDGIQLKTGDVERTILAARNRYAHGGVSSRGQEVFLSAASKAYEALLSRAILKAIGYSGQYTDYSTYGFPMRDLNEPLGGPEGDGKIAPPTKSN